MLVYLHKNYNTPDLFRQTVSGSGRWNDIQFTTECPEECDYIVVLNHPVQNIKSKCRKGGRILIIQEPPYENNNYLIDHFPYFDIIISAFDKKYSPNIIHTQGGLPWLIDKDFQELCDLILVENKKLDKASWVTSTKNLNSGHEPRLKFLDQLKKRKDLVDLFGRGLNPIDNKFDGIYPYKYALAIENYSDNNYWTEKVSDAYLSWSMPIYYGCKNLHDFFPENSFIEIDIHKAEEAFEIIDKAIKDKLWDKNKNAIKEARELILHKYQLFPFVAGIIDTIKKNEDSDKISVFIPLDPNKSRGFVDKIKAYIHRSIDKR
jgi:hypothetical protein